MYSQGREFLLAAVTFLLIAVVAVAVLSFLGF